MKHSKQLLEQMQTYSKAIKLHPSLREVARTKEQADYLLRIQERALDHDKKVLAVMDNYGFKNPKSEEEQAFEKLYKLIAYCEKFAEQEADLAIKQLKAVKLPLATSERYKMQQMKTDIKQDFIARLTEVNLGFENINNIASLLLQLASN